MVTHNMLSETDKGVKTMKLEQEKQMKNSVLQEWSYPDDDYECEFCGDNSLYCYCEEASNCDCGAYVFNQNRKAVHVADCICGNT